jgi:hypothetical protein
MTSDSCACCQRRVHKSFLAVSIAEDVGVRARISIAILTHT